MGEPLGALATDDQESAKVCTTVKLNSLVWGLSILRCFAFDGMRDVKEMCCERYENRKIFQWRLTSIVRWLHMLFRLRSTAI